MPNFPSPISSYGPVNSSMCVFFFSSRRRHTRSLRDWSSDVCSSDLPPKAYAEQWDVEGLEHHVREFLGLELPIKAWAAEDGIANEEIEERIIKAADARVAERDAQVGDHMRTVEKSFLLQMI